MGTIAEKRRLEAAGVGSGGGNVDHYVKKPLPFYEDDTLETFDESSNLDVGTTCETKWRGQRVMFHDKEEESYGSMVNLDSFEFHKIIFNSYLSEVLQSTFFRFGILFLVMLNAALIGLKTVAEVEREWNMWFIVSDQIIVTVFIFEIVVKWLYDFRLFWSVTWNILDFTIVGFIIFAYLVPDLAKNGNLIVIVRVVRAFRSLRSVSSLASLTIVTHTVVRSFIDMVNILLVLMLFMLVMAVMGVTLFTSTGSRWFLNAADAWFVVFICVTQDGWNEVLENFRDMGLDSSMYSLVCIYLMIAVSVGAFVFANLIVAVIVANLELSVKDLREETQSNDNPLEFKGQFSVKELDVLPVYSVFANNNLPLRLQRPMKLPDFRHISPRRLQAYLMLIVNLEQNMLEADIISADLEKIMTVVLSIVKQITKLTPERSAAERAKGAKILNQINNIGDLAFERQEPVKQMVLLDDINRVRKARSIEVINEKRQL